MPPVKRPLNADSCDRMVNGVLLIWLPSSYPVEVLSRRPSSRALTAMDGRQRLPRM